MTINFPQFAPRIYSDGRSIFLEFPTREGNPATCLAFELSDNGLAKALKHIPNIALDPGYVRPGSGNLVDHLLKPIRVAKRTQTKRASARMPSTVKDRAREIAKKVRY
jgi:hypothetical protein